VERLVRAWRWRDRREEERKHLWRSVSCWVDLDGMVILRARLTAEQGAIVQQALESASDRLYRESEHAAPPARVAEEVTSDQRRADALTLLAESALKAEFDRGSAADRHQVVLHVQAGVPPVIELADGPISVSAETSRRLSCDASVVVMHEDADGTVLDVGRKTRTVPASIRRALNSRDGHRCAFPGCNARRCDAHHVVHWMDGGPTALDNLVLLCRRHHTLLHDNGFSVERNHEGDAVFRRPDGRLIDVSPALAWSGSHVVPPGVGARSLHVWGGAPLNIGYAIDVLRPQPEGWLPRLS
jgi:hypothetical protein